jgi:hypothetical protein
MMTIKAWPIGALLVLAGCTDLHNTPDLESIVISSFQSQEPESCRSSDVPLDPSRVRAFFQRASKIDSRTLHDRYEWAPCYLEGSLKYNGQVCTWQVRAGATGVVQCPSAEQYFTCEECSDLFAKPGD